MNVTTKNYIFASSKTWHFTRYQAFAKELSINSTWVCTPDELKSAVAERQPRYIFFLHWSWIVPRAIWESVECVCFHMTDVPYGRGGSPLQNLIMAGHEETKLTALRMTENVDAGPVYVKRPLSLTGRAQDIYIRAGKVSFEISRWMIEAEPAPVPQEGEVVIFKRRNPSQSALPEQGSLRNVYDHIRMLDADTYPHAFIEYGNFRLEFSDADLCGDGVQAKVMIRNAPPGKRGES